MLSCSALFALSLCDSHQEGWFGGGVAGAALELVGMVSQEVIPSVKLLQLIGSRWSWPLWAAVPGLLSTLPPAPLHAPPRPQAARAIAPHPCSSVRVMRLAALRAGWSSLCHASGRRSAPLLHFCSSRAARFHKAAIVSGIRAQAMAEDQAIAQQLLDYINASDTQASQ